MAKLLICFIACAIYVSDTLAFDYFESDINYWKQETKGPHTPRKAPEAIKKLEGSFDWQSQLDPKNDEFFKEGQHTPPAAVMEMMRHPTDKNIKNWFALIKKKNKLAQRLQDRMAEYLKSNRVKINPEEQKIIESEITSLPKTSPDYKRFRFRLYFESSCTHCKKMMATMTDLQNMGYFVELRQIDDNQKIRKGLPFPVVKASKQELSKKKINAWPVLLVGDLKKKVVYRINGYQSTRAVLDILKSK